MWYTLYTSQKTDPVFAALANELLESMLRALTLITGGAYMVWMLVMGITQTDELMMQLMPIMIIVAIVCMLTLRLIPRQLMLAQIVWQVGLFGVITIAIYIFQSPFLALFYALLPLVAAITLGWPAIVLSEGVVSLLTWLILPSLPIQALPFQVLQMIIISGGMVTGVLGWATVYALFTSTVWALSSMQKARTRMKEAFDQRVELKQTQEDLIQANRELARMSDRLKAMHQIAEEARQAKQEFVANVSHELRTPLNMIIGFSEMIPKLSQVYGVDLPSALLSDIAAIQRNSQHLSQLVNDVLDMSQMEAGRMMLNREWCTVQEIIDEAVLATRVLFESKSLYLDVDITPGLPRVFCDITRIRQVVLNLLSNAGRFTDYGGVKVRAWCEKDEVRVSVADTGPGITEEKKKKLFEPFQQLNESIRRRRGGSGLGLSISKRFVEMHGGRMWVESRVRVGTTFYFALPISMPPPAVLDKDSATRWFNPYESVEFKLRTRRSKAPLPDVVPRFVIVEKGETLQRLFHHYAPTSEIITTADLDTAIQALTRSPAQALILNTPPENPQISAEKLKDLPYDTPVVTCWIPGEDEAIKDLDVEQYLVKPVTRDVLLSTVEKFGTHLETVLLVDDEPEALRLFTRMLSTAEKPYRILQTTNGQRALNLLHERHPDLVLLDLIMPGMDGFEVLKVKRQDAKIKDIPVVIVSSKDPSGEPIVSNTLTIMRGGGLSGRDLLTCVQLMSEILSPSQVGSLAPGDQVL